ncbi:hypothetical protein PACTADRAFT_49848 [Pachysolen tannophilus NRRL Y-2460]|uniref:CN hydrolase domain-containing protein n=1 Tax=Pachysolen tannophilus NRRL Y-2460 TaxID=669874 RepID=A0A1E4TXX7_PACTA|nr:hypothetical protein PACTADRAFT_49848 [Pachysolen tannophilus NRRL Y-2460]
MSPLLKTLSIALIQLHTTANKSSNLLKVKQYVQKALTEKPSLDLVMLPECFNSPYSVTEFRNYAENVPNGETTKFLSELAKEHKVFIIGGSIPELGLDNKVYNTSLSFDKTGKLIAKHRKVHLFDIDIPNGITFKESITLSGGEKATVFDLDGYGNVGLGICYDIRFPELAAIAARKNSFAMFYPGAFNTTTGPLHWHLLARARAIDNQTYVVLCSPARDLSSGYHAYGHSLIVDPNGKIIVEAGENEEIVYGELDPSYIDQIRSGIPITTQRRFDVYDDVSVNAKVSDI